MRVYKITTPNSKEFITLAAEDLVCFPTGTTVVIAEMTPEEYYARPATSESAEAFKR